MRSHSELCFVVSEQNFGLWNRVVLFERFLKLLRLTGAYGHWPVSCSLRSLEKMMINGFCNLVGKKRSPWLTHTEYEQNVKKSYYNKITKMSLEFFQYSTSRLITEKKYTTLPISRKTLHPNNEGRVKDWDFKIGTFLTKRSIVTKYEGEPLRTTIFFTNSLVKSRWNNLQGWVTRSSQSLSWTNTRSEVGINYLVVRVWRSYWFLSMAQI